MKTIWATVDPKSFPVSFDSPKKKRNDLLSGEEIDQLSEEQLAGKSQMELKAFMELLSDTWDAFYAPDGCEVDSPEWRRWEARLDHLDRMMDAAEALMQEEE